MTQDHRFTVEELSRLSKGQLIHIIRSGFETHADLVESARTLNCDSCQEICKLLKLPIS